MSYIKCGVYHDNNNDIIVEFSTMIHWSGSDFTIFLNNWIKSGSSWAMWDAEDTTTAFCRDFVENLFNEGSGVSSIYFKPYKMRLDATKLTTVDDIVYRLLLVLKEHFDTVEVVASGKTFGRPEVSITD